MAFDDHVCKFGPEAMGYAEVSICARSSVGHHAVSCQDSQAAEEQVRKCGLWGQECEREGTTRSSWVRASERGSRMEGGEASDSKAEWA